MRARKLQQLELTLSTQKTCPQGSMPIQLLTLPPQTRLNHPTRELLLNRKHLRGLEIHFWLLGGMDKVMAEGIIISDIRLLRMQDKFRVAYADQRIEIDFWQLIDIDLLTPNQKKILDLLEAGYTDTDIVRELSLSHTGIRKRIRDINEVLAQLASLSS